MRSRWQNFSACRDIKRLSDKVLPWESCEPYGCGYPEGTILFFQMVTNGRHDFIRTIAQQGF